MTQLTKLLVILAAASAALSAPLMKSRQLAGEGSFFASVFSGTDNGVGYGVENAEDNAATLLGGKTTTGGGGSTSNPPPPPSKVKRQADKIATGAATDLHAVGQDKAALTQDAATLGAQVGGDEEDFLERTGDMVPSPFKAPVPPDGHSVGTLGQFGKVLSSMLTVIYTSNMSTSSMSSLVNYEAFVDECAELLKNRLSELCAAGQAVDMHHWLQCYAFDVIGMITYGKRLGFLDRGEDVGNVINALGEILGYATIVGIVFPTLHNIIVPVMNFFAGSKGQGGAYVTAFTKARISETQSNPKAVILDDSDASTQSFLMKFLAKNTSKPDAFTSSHVISGCLINMIAGSDTTAISLSAVLYYLLKNPSCVDKLREEVDTFTANGQLSTYVTYKESQGMPYLQAVIKEALRLHPATGLPLERVVPKDGATISGRFFPEGAVVGINTWVAHRDRSVFGQDADSFSPERWLQDDEERAALMNRFWMPTTTPTPKADRMFPALSSLSALTSPAIIVDGTSFALNGKNVSYRFHVDPATGDLLLDHFGDRVTENPVAQIMSNGGGWSTQAHLRREFPDLGRGDFRTPAVHIKHAKGFTVCNFKYKSHSVVKGKPAIEKLPSTFGSDDDVSTLIIHLYDECSSVGADLSYSIFPNFDAIVRNVKIINKSDDVITVEKLSSFSVDFPHENYEMLQLQGEWTRECNRTRRKVEYGLQGFGSTTGYSSHYHNPFLSMASPTTTESHGEAWGFSLVYTGSFSVEVEKSHQGLTRALVGMNPCQLSWPLRSGESLQSPECVSVFSNLGIGEMSRKFHRLYRQNLIRSKFVSETRPVLLNSWEGLYFDFDDKTIYKLAQESAKLGAKLFVLDDGWFGDKHPRVNDHAGLGDWVANPKRFPSGLDSLAKDITKLQVKDSDEKLQFGLWFEPEMVNQKSELYEQHPEWVLSAGNYARSETRQQLVLNAALPEVQDFIISSVSKILETVPVSYVKWDNNRAIHESPTPDNHHAYILGIYHVFDVLTARFPDVLWEGCASGGGRFDPGILQYFPQVWTSDNMDAFDRIHIQFGTSLVYPPSTMGAHVCSAPNDVTGRSIPMSFRAHVAMMGGSFGFELNPDHTPEEDKAQIPDLIKLAEKINPIIIKGDMWRLVLPEDSNFPAAIFVSEDGSQAVLFAFQIRATTVLNYPLLRLAGLDPAARYKLDGAETYSGATLMNGGIQFRFGTDYDSKVVLLERV
ncbi:putative alpha-galactosidase C precursor [Fusarium bulbicola]|nr:putative alpha-galactosidase C precursor [Fusarium bulbicola]